MKNKIPYNEVEFFIPIMFIFCIFITFIIIIIIIIIIIAVILAKTFKY